MHLCPCRSDDGEQRDTRHAFLTFPASSSQYVDQIVAFIIPHSLLNLTLLAAKRYNKKETNSFYEYACFHNGVETQQENITNDRTYPRYSRSGKNANRQIS